MVLHLVLEELEEVNLVKPIREVGTEPTRELELQRILVHLHLPPHHHSLRLSQVPPLPSTEGSVSVEMGKDLSTVVTVEQEVEDGMEVLELNLILREMTINQVQVVRDMSIHHQLHLSIPLDVYWTVLCI